MQPLTKKQYANIFRCQVCGKFISFKGSQDRRKVKSYTRCDYYYVQDFCGYYPEPCGEMAHVKCINRAKQKQRYNDSK